MCFESKEAKAASKVGYVAGTLGSCEGLDRKKDNLMDLDGRFDAVEVNVNNLVSCGGNLQDVWDVLILGANLGKTSALLARERSASSPQHIYQAKVHLLHGVSVLGRAKNTGSWTGGCWTPGLFVERSPSMLSEGMGWQDSKEYQSYEEEMGITPPFVMAEDLVKVAEIWCGLTGTGKRPKVFKISSEDTWHRHILNNHQPFRRDCALCLRNGGVGRQHRATPNPRAYVLSVDVAGSQRRWKGLSLLSLGSVPIPEAGFGDGKGASNS